MMSADPTQFLVLIALAAITALPLALLRDKYPQPAYLIGAGGGIELAARLLKYVVSVRIPPVLTEAVSVVLIVSGIVLLFDAHYPTRGFLPGALARNRRVDRSDLILPILLAGFVVCSMVVTTITSWTIGASPINSLATGVAILVMIPPWVIFRRRYSPVLWVVHRQPETIVWVFVQQTKLFRRGYNQPINITWSADIGLENGLILAIIASQSESEIMAAEIAALCPTATIGFSEERRTSYFRDPKSLRLALAPPT